MKYRINESEYRFMEILWEKEPVSSMELVRVCGERLDWKKSTTFTVMRKLCQKKIACNEDTIVRACVSQEQVQRQESRAFLDRKFGGSLPLFLTAYLQDRRLTREEAEKIKQMIEEASQD